MRFAFLAVLLMVLHLVCVQPMCTQQTGDWVKLSLPPGEITRSMGSFKDTMYVLGTELHRSTDNGRNWEKAPSPASRSFLPSIFTYDMKGAGLIGGTQDAQPSPRPLFRQAVGGTWQEVLSFPRESVKGIHVDSANTYYVTTRANRIYRSHDEGENWAVIVDGGMEPATLTVFPDGTLTASFGGVMKYSEDEGDSWSDATFNGFEQVSKRLTRYAHQPSVSIATFSNGVVIRTTDAGRTWDSVAALPEAFRFSTTGVTGSGHFLALTFDFDLFRSDPDGIMWTKLGEALNHGGPVSFTALPNSETMATGNGGPYRSTDNGETWKNSASGIEATEIHDLAVRNGTELFVSTSEHGVISTSDMGETWKFHLPVTTPRSILAMEDGNVLGMNTFEVWLIEPERNAFSTLSRLPSSLLHESPYKSFAVHEWNGRNILAYSWESGYVSISEDQGVTWKEIEVAPKSFDSHVAISRSSYVYVTVAGVLYRAAVEDLLTEEAPEWSIVFRTNSPLVALATLGDSVLTCGDESTVWFSSDGGDTWREHPLPASTCCLRRLSIGPDTALHAVVLDLPEYTLYSKRSGDNQWAKEVIFNGLMTNAVFEKDGARFVAGKGTGLYHKGAVSGVNNPPSTKAVALSVYPNPANNEARLLFHCIQPGTYHITITDVLGQVQFRGDAIDLTEGLQVLPLELGGLPSGEYRCEVHSHEVGVQRTASLRVVR